MNNKIRLNNRLFSGTMLHPKRLLLLCLLTGFALPGGHSSLAQPLDNEGTITAFEASDRDYLEKQYELLQKIVNDALSTRFTGEKEHDLTVLQKLINSGVIKADQRRELQAMGVVMGRTLAKEFDLRWVVFRDSLGRSRALQIDQTSRVVFPMTMLSRRLEVGARANVQEVYAKAARIIEYTRANHVLY